MSVSLKRHFVTQNEAFAFASGLEQSSGKGIHHIHVAETDDDPMAPYVVKWIEEGDLEDRYEIHPPTY